MISQQITRRLSRDTSYKSTSESYQKTLTPEDIQKKLIDYLKVTHKEEIAKIPLETHIRYFSINKKTGEKLFRLGGFLKKVEEDYVVLSNNKLSWSVQLDSSIIYKKLLPEQLVKKIETKVYTEVKKEIDKTSRSAVDKLTKENAELRKIIKQIKDTTINNKTKK